MTDELHIASFVVQARPEAADEVADAVQALAAAEVAAREGGKLIVLVEASGSREVLGVVDALRELTGVLSVNLVYHHAEARDWLNEEIADGHPA